jgi:hypothetical protein
MELILQTDWQTMEGSDGLLVFRIVIVELLGVRNRSVEEYLVKTVNLRDGQCKICHESVDRDSTIW